MPQPPNPLKPFLPFVCAVASSRAVHTTARPARAEPPKASPAEAASASSSAETPPRVVHGPWRTPGFVGHGVGVLFATVGVFVARKATSDADAARERTSAAD